MRLIIVIADQIFFLHRALLSLLVFLNLCYLQDLLPAYYISKSFFPKSIA
jgi:hypothetical protein